MPRKARRFFLIFPATLMIFFAFQNCSSQFSTDARNLASTTIFQSSSQSSKGSLSVSRSSSASAPVLKDASGNVFYPRGVNLIRLYPSAKQSGLIWHKMFHPDRYNKEEIEETLKSLSNDGYNVIRYYVDPEELFGLSSSTTIDPLHLNNMIDFHSRAARYGVRLVLTLHWVPDAFVNKNSSQDEIIKVFPGIGGLNLMLLTQAGREAMANYAGAILSALKKNNALTPLFAIDLWNEAEIDMHEPPFSQTSGVFRRGRRSYEMSSDRDRQDLMDQLSIDYANYMHAAIKSIAPEILTYISVFPPTSVDLPGYNGLIKTNANTRYPFRAHALNLSNLDMIGIHLYSWRGVYTLDEDMRALEYSSLSKPLFMDEYGSFTSSTTVSALPAMTLEFMKARCAYENIVGGLFWTYDDSRNTQPTLYNLKSTPSVNEVIRPRSLGKICASNPIAKLPLDPIPFAGSFTETGSKPATQVPTTTTPNTNTTTNTQEPSSISGGSVSTGSSNSSVETVSLQEGAYCLLSGTCIYVNLAKASYCTYRNFEEFKNATGGNHLGAIDLSAHKLKFEGACLIAKKRMTIGYQCMNNGLCIYANGAGRYCTYQDWEIFKKISGNNYALNRGSLTDYSDLSDGACK